MKQAKRLELTALIDFPMIQPGDDLAACILKSAKLSEVEVQDGDIFVLAQKVVSKAEDRLVNLTTVEPSAEAIELAEYLEKRPELVELILQESNAILRTRPGTIIVEQKKVLSARMPALTIPMSLVRGAILKIGFCFCRKIRTFRAKNP